MSDVVRVRVPASTSNLGPGFDTLGLALKLYLGVEATQGAPAPHIELTGKHGKGLPRTRENLVYRTYTDACEYFNWPVQTLRLRIDNPVPPGRGLGSSGTAIVAGLRIAQALAPEQISEDDLCQFGISLEQHPENVTASFYGGLTVSCRQGNRWLTQNHRVDEQLKAVVLVPEIEISTASARTALPPEVAFQDAVFNIQNTAMMTAALISGNYTALAAACRDAIHQRWRGKFVPGFDSIVDTAIGAGADAAFLSGSGSGILALAHTDVSRVAEAMTAMASEQNWQFELAIYEIDNRGATARHD